MPVQSIDYAKLTGQDPASKSLVREFARHHAKVITIESDGTERKTSGVAFKTLNLSFADSQQVALDIKKTGDIFAVRINGRVVPIKNQDDLNKAVVEIIDRLDAGRKAFQKRQAMVRVDAPKPKNLSMTAANQTKILEEKRDNLKTELEAVRAERATVEAEIGASEAVQNESAPESVTSNAGEAVALTQDPASGLWQASKGDVSSNLHSSQEVAKAKLEEALQDGEAEHKTIGEYLTEHGQDAFKAARAFFDDHLRDQTINTVIGEVHVNGKSWKEMKRGMKSDPMKAMLMGEVRHILTEGEYLGRDELNKARDDKFVAFHFFAKWVELGQYDVLAGVTVGERDDGIKQMAYGLGHGFEKRWAKKEAGLLARGEEPRVPTIKSGSPALDSSVGDDMEGVNIVILQVIDKATGKRMTDLEDIQEESEEPPTVPTSFTPTHTDSRGNPVRATDEPGVYVDADGYEIEDEYAEPIKDVVEPLPASSPVVEPENVAEATQNTPIEITGTELGVFDDNADGVIKRRDATRAHLEGTLRGKWIDVGAIGQKVEIRQSGIDESIAWSAKPEKLKALAKLDTIISGAHSPDYQPNHKKKKKPAAIQYIHLKNSVVIEGKRTDFFVIVEEDVNGLLHYDIMIDAQKAKAALDSSSTADAVAILSRIPNPGFIHEPILDRAGTAVNGMVLNLFIEGEEDEEEASSEPEQSPMVEKTAGEFKNATTEAVNLFVLAQKSKQARNAYATAKAIEEGLTPVAVHWDATSELPDEWIDEALDAVGLFGEGAGGFIKGSIKDSKGSEIASVTIRGDGDVMFLSNQDHAEASEFDPADDDFEFGRWVGGASSGVGNMIDKIKASVDFGRDRAPIEAYKQAFADGADLLSHAISGVTDDADPKAETARLQAVAKQAQSNIDAAKKAAIEAGFDPFGDDMDVMATDDANEYWERTEELRYVLRDLAMRSKELASKLAKDDLKAIPDNAPMEAYAALVFRAHGIEVADDNPMLDDFIKAIRDRNADKLLRVLATGVSNQASKEIFERATRMKLEKTQKARAEQIDAWAGITPEKRKAMNDEREEDRRIAKTIEDVNESWDAMKNLQARGEDGSAISVQQWIKDKNAEGYSEVGTTKKGVATIYGMVDSTGHVVFVKHPLFTAFMKAAKAYGGLQKALAMVGAFFPNANSK